MCMRSYPRGIPIPDEVHQQYSEELKACWRTFDDWWHSVEGEVSKDDMPEEVLQAYNKINETEIPGTGQPGSASCYMIGVKSFLK